MKKLLKCLLYAFTIQVLCISANAQIVNNSGSTAADSVSLPFYLLDSVGNLATLTSGDSVYLIVYRPNGQATFIDTLGSGSSLITSTTIQGFTVYNWKAAVADIDGPAPVDGLYSYIIWVWDRTSASLATPHKGVFQLYQASDFNVWATAVRDTLSLLQAMNNRFFPTRGVTSGTPTTTKFIATALTQADDYWNDNIVVFTNGAAVGQAARVHDFFTTGDSCQLNPPLSVAPASGDSFYMTSMLMPLRVTQNDGRAFVNIDSTSGTIAAAQLETGMITASTFAAGAIDVNAMATGSIGTAQWAANAEVWDETASSHAAGTVGGALDSSRFFDKIRDTVYAVLDTLQRYTKAATDSTQAILDSTQALDISERMMMNPLPGSIIPNGWLQVYVGTDTTAIAGWGAGQNTRYLTTRQPFPGMKWSLYLDGTAAQSSQTTLDAKLDTGTFLVTAMVKLPLATDSIFFQCYNSASVAQNWASSGTDKEWATDWTGWRQFTRLIRLVGDSTFYFAIVVDAGDSGYVGNFGVIPYGAVGHTVVAAAGASKEQIADAVNDTLEAGTRQIKLRSFTVDSGTIFNATTTGQGFTINGGSASGDAVHIAATSGDGVDISGGGTGNGNRITGGATSGSGEFIQGGGIGNGQTIWSGAGATGVGTLVQAKSTNGNATQYDGSGNGAGLLSQGGLTGKGLYTIGGVTSGDGFRSVAQADGRGIWSIGGATDGNESIRMTTAAANANALSATGTGTGSGLVGTAGGGSGGAGMALTGGATSGDALKLSKSTGGFITTAARQELASAVGDSVLRIAFNSSWPAGSLADSLNNASYMTGSGSGLDSTTMSRLFKRLVWGIAQGLGSDSTTISQRKVVFADSVRALGNFAGEQGGIAGADKTWTVYVVDTSGADNIVSSAKITVNDGGGVTKLVGTTDAQGKVIFTVTTGTWTLLTSNTGYVFTSQNKTVSANQTDSVFGYDIVIGAPAGGNQVRVFGYSQDVLDTVDAMGDVWAHIELLQSVNNTCDSTFVTRFTKRKQVDAATGLFSFDVVYSSCLSNAKYKVWLVGASGQATKEVTFTAPSTATYRVFAPGGGN